MGATHRALVFALEDSTKTLDAATKLMLEARAHLDLPAVRSSVSRTWQAAEQLHRAYEDAYAESLRR
jgi:hypothetical protein